MADIFTLVMDFVGSGVGLIERFFERITNGRDGEDAAAICHQGVALMGCAGMEDDDAFRFFGFFDASDGQSFIVASRISFRRQYNICGVSFVPLDMSIYRYIPSY